MKECDIEIIRYNGDLEQQWDDFIRLRAKNATFLHTRKFFDYNPLNKADDHSLLFLRKGKIIGLIPFNSYEHAGSRRLHSYLRSTYGGLIIANDCSIDDIDSMIRLLLEHAHAERFHEVIIRPSFSIYHATLSGEIDYLFWKNKFRVASRELELAIDLRLPVEDNYSDSTKRSIKKASKLGVKVEESAGLEQYWQVLEENLRERYNRKPVHSLEEIKRLISLVGADKVRLFSATLNDKVIAGILTFVANERVLHAQYIASDYQYQEYRPLNAVIDFIAKTARQEQFGFFNLGMVSEPGGDELNTGLARFKEGFGARGVLRETLQIGIPKMS